MKGMAAAQGIAALAAVQRLLQFISEWLRQQATLLFRGMLTSDAVTLMGTDGSDGRTELTEDMAMAGPCLVHAGYRAAVTDLGESHCNDGCVREVEGFGRMGGRTTTIAGCDRLWLGSYPWSH